MKACFAVIRFLDFLVKQFFQADRKLPSPDKVANDVIPQDISQYTGGKLRHIM